MMAIVSITVINNWLTKIITIIMTIMVTMLLMFFVRCKLIHWGFSNYVLL